MVERALFAQQIDDTRVGEHSEVGTQAALTLVVAVLSARKKVRDGIGYRVFYETLRGFMATGMVAVTGTRDRLNRLVIQLKKALPGYLPARVLPRLTELAQEIQ